MVILFLVLTWYEITPMSTSSSCAPFSFFSIGVRDGDMEETTASQKLYLYDYQKQFDHDRIDLVVFGDDDALSKLREHRDELKKNINEALGENNSSIYVFEIKDELKHIHPYVQVLVDAYFHKADHNNFDNIYDTAIKPQCQRFWGEPVILKTLKPCYFKDIEIHMERIASLSRVTVDVTFHNYSATRREQQKDFELFIEMAAADYADKYPVNPQPDARQPPLPNYTVSVEVMEEKQHCISQHCLKSFKVLIDGITSAENPFTNQDVSEEISRDMSECCS